MVLLSFDTEEFDVPREHGVDFPLSRGMEVSEEGTNHILDTLGRNGVNATFFCTSNFVRNAPQTMARIKREGHEIACHGCDHWQPKATDVKESKVIIEQLMRVTCHGYRQPRMFPVSDEAIRSGGYTYNSSLNPAFIPGRYMHLTTPRTCFVKDGVLQIPTSVSPWLRIPLFWLSLYNFPEGLYHWLVRRVLRHDGYFNTYFHPWEFVELNEHPEYRMPYIIRNHSGRQMQERLDRLIRMLQAQGETFTTYYEFAKSFTILPFTNYKFKHRQ
ncbi:MAG: polysaccharide deacetylase family protein [Bacteroidales bacterium]|nr:polysaccharide deacetylase family protein [Bacteroidales bacterium]